MLDSLLPLIKNRFTGANVLICTEVPLHEVNIRSSLINGKGIPMILGNDLAGESVMVDPRVVEKPRDDEKTKSSQVYSLPLW